MNNKKSNSLKTKEHEFDEVTNINFKGAYFITQAVAKKLIKCKKPGSLINISSQMGQVGGLERAVYSASKHAVEGFTKSMAIELGKYNISDDQGLNSLEVETGYFGSFWSGIKVDNGQSLLLGMTPKIGLIPYFSNSS